MKTTAQGDGAAAVGPARSAKRVHINKHGQALGRKGRETRQRLMEATRRLLRSQSPVELTAVSIAKEAKTSSATFYIYFDDVRDVILALSEAASADLVIVHRILEEPWDPRSVDLAHAQRVVNAFNEVWDSHRDILRFRNVEADRGDRAFAEQRINSAVRIIDRFAERVLGAYQLTQAKPSRGEAYAEATVVFAAMEGLAETDPKHVTEWQIGAERLSRSMAMMLARSFGARFLTTEPPLTESAKKVAAKPAKQAAPAKSGKRKTS